MCTLRTSSHDNAHFIARLCCRVPARAVERAMKAQPQSKLDEFILKFQVLHAQNQKCLCISSWSC